MKKTFVSLMLAFIAISLVAPMIHAGTPTPAPKNTPKPKKHHTTIASVDASSITVKEGDDKTVTYKITPQTEITYKGNTATVADLKPGMRVDVAAGMDPGEADRITADDAPPKDK